MSKALMSNEEFKTTKLEKETTFFPSRFNFLKMQNGLRPGFMHILLGETGKGKSTLLRAMALDCCVDPFAKVLIWLTEEEEKDYKFELNHQAMNKGLLERLEVCSELTMASVPKDIKGYVARIEQTLVELNCNALFFDNFTTSKTIQCADPRAEGVLAMELRELASRAGISLVILTHTRKGSQKVLSKLGADDVRGNATIVNTAQFVYALQPLSDSSGRTDFLHVEKARGYPSHAKTYILTYDLDLKTYMKDSRALSEEFWKKALSVNDLHRGKNGNITAPVRVKSTYSWDRD